jgi:hypothetical protein
MGLVTLVIVETTCISLLIILYALLGIYLIKIKANKELIIVWLGFMLTFLSGLFFVAFTDYILV